MTARKSSSIDGNLLLEALNAADRALLAPHVERREVSRGDVLFRAGDDVSHVTFPAQRCVVTLVVPLIDGKSVETATIGREGAMGGVVSHGYLPAFGQAVQVGGPVAAVGQRMMQSTARLMTRQLFGAIQAEATAAPGEKVKHGIVRDTLRGLKKK